MAPPRRPWFRFYVEAIHDRKLRRIPPAQRWLWVVVLSVARSSARVPYLAENGSNGALTPFADEDLADLAAIPVKDVRSGLKAFVSAGMLTHDDLLGCLFVTKWNERQFESDDVAIRTAKHRSNSARCNDDGTFHQRSMERPWNVDVTPPDTETETDTETEVLQTLASAPPNAPKPTHLPVVVATSKAAQQEKAPDQLWDALMTACGIEGPPTPSARGAYNKALADLRSVDATPDEVAVRARAYRTRFPDAALTPSALARHWAECNGHHQPNGRRSEPKGAQGLRDYHRIRGDQP